jgi:hypothetical protein
MGLRPRQAVLLAGAILVGACAPHADRGCAQASTRDAVYPFTGQFASATSGRVLCLYQHDARSVSGAAGAASLIGTVRPDGTLVFATGGASPTLVVARLSADTLQLIQIYSDSGLVPGARDRLLRR